MPLRASVRTPVDLTVHVLGIRHHGPGSARSVVHALDELRPDLVLVEGAPELDQVVALLADPGMRPPVAGLVYAVDEPRRAVFYPLASFSPEWVAVRWALAHDVPVRFADLPITHQLTEPEPEPEPDAEPDADADARPRRAPGRAPRPDPIGLLAATAGYDDPERWWEDAVEHRGGSNLARFAAVTEAMALVRDTDERDADDPDVVENARREAAMRRSVRVAAKEGFERIAFVCGAYHAPVLDPATYPTQKHDNDLLSGLPRTKVAATWAPWSSGRLALASGYGAGVTSPGWYQHLFDHWSREGPEEGRDDLATGWLVRVARELRAQRLDASTASVVEASRLATALAAVRGRPSVGLSELDDAAEAVLCEGSRVPLGLVHDSLVVGRELGAVPDEAPMVPLAADLARQQRALRLKPTARVQTVVLDLRRPGPLARSVLLHRLRLLGVDWGTESDAGASTGTFKEAWELEWRPELAVAVIEAGLFGTTVASAAATKVAERAEEAEDLATLARLVAACLVADLAEGLASVVARLEERTARQHDVLAMLGAVEPLARTIRYGDVRGVEVGGVADVLRALVVRASVGLPAACNGLDDDAAAVVRAGIEGADRGVALLDDPAMRERWTAALVAVAARDGVHGSVAGRVDRLLLDAGRIERDEAAGRMSRRLSTAAPAGDSAAWLDGFLSGESVLLVHDPALLAIVDAWVEEIPERVFEDLLPLLRRTFSRFQPPQRRTIAEHVRRLDGAADLNRPETTRFDLERAAPAVARVAELLGLEVRRGDSVQPAEQVDQVDQVDQVARDRLTRWRLVLGGGPPAEGLGAGDGGQGITLSDDDQKRDAALEALYDGDRRSGLGGSAPKVSRWLGDIRGYFPTSVVQVMQADAMDRLGLRQLLLEPEMMGSVTPDVSMVTTLVGLGRAIPERSRETARQVVRTVTDQLEERLRSRTVQAVTGALDRSARTRRPPLRDVDWRRTIAANLRHYLPEQRTVVPERLVGYARRTHQVERDIVLCIDQSGSMAESVVFSSVFGAVLASLRSVRTRLVVFDTEVVDLTDELDDPVDVLFGVQLGGGTDINRALAYCESVVERPTDTVLVLVSDLFEGGIAEEMVRRSAALVDSGVTMVALLALSDSGRPSYDADHAAALAGIGVPAFACTPDLFPDLMAAAIERRDLTQWAADHDLVTSHEPG